MLFTQKVEGHERRSFRRSQKAIVEYDSEGAVSWARKAVQEKMDPVEAIDIMTVSIRQIGDGFTKGEFWFPDLVGIQVL